MPWLCFLLVNTTVVQGAPPLPGAGAKPLRFDVAALAETRDSFVFRVRGEERGWAVWQYEHRTDVIVFTAVSELRPPETERPRGSPQPRTCAPPAAVHPVQVFASR